MILWDIAFDCHKDSPYIDYRNIEKYKQTVCYKMQILAYNMILRGEYYG